MNILYSSLKKIRYGDSVYNIIHSCLISDDKIDTLDQIGKYWIVNLEIFERKRTLIFIFFFFEKKKEK